MDQLLGGFAINRLQGGVEGTLEHAGKSEVIRDHRPSPENQPRLNPSNRPSQPGIPLEVEIAHFKSLIGNEKWWAVKDSNLRPIG